MCWKHFQHIELPFSYGLAQNNAENEANKQENWSRDSKKPIVCCWAGALVPPCQAHCRLGCRQQLLCHCHIAGRSVLPVLPDSEWWQLLWKMDLAWKVALWFCETPVSHRDGRWCGFLEKTVWQRGLNKEPGVLQTRFLMLADKGCLWAF